MVCLLRRDESSRRTGDLVAFEPGADHHDIVHFSALIAFIGYSVAMWQLSIWDHRSWATTLRYTVDGAIYGFLTGLMFGWFWPH